MKRLFRVGLIVAILFISVPLHADDVFIPTGYEVITVDSTAGGVALTASKYFNSTTGGIVSDYAIIVNETAQIRFRVDGGAPTTTVGTPLQVNQGWALGAYRELANFRAIRTGTTSGSLNVIYYKRSTSGGR